jgi:hypothetical protein
MPSQEEGAGPGAERAVGAPRERAHDLLAHLGAFTCQRREREPPPSSPSRLAAL